VGDPQWKQESTMAEVNYSGGVAALDGGSAVLVVGGVPVYGTSEPALKYLILFGNY